jgi:release factor glutamine methyltransferase
MAEPKAAWTILEILRWTTDYFRDKAVSEPRASAEVLLAHTLGVSRLDLYLRYDQPLTPEELARFKALMVRRRNGEPVAYLTGHREFWSLDFRVTPAVLIPRPETETLVAATLEAARLLRGEGEGCTTPTLANNTGNSRESSPPAPNRGILGLEIGVGSGAVVIALAKELPEITWVGVDLSAAALEVARDNVRRQGVADRVHLLQADLLTAFKAQPSFDLLVANLPYVPRQEWERLPKDIKDFEPHQALVGGEDGLDLISRVIGQAHRIVGQGGWVLLEVGDGQASSVAALLAETGAYDHPETIIDFNKIARVVRARRRLG